MSLAQQPIGELLIAEGFVSEADVAKALEAQSQIDARLGQILIRQGAISEDFFLPVLSRQLGVLLLDSKEIPAQKTDFEALAGRLGYSLVWLLEQGFCAWEAQDGFVICASPDPLNSVVREAFSHLVPKEKIRWALIRGRDHERLASLFVQQQHQGGGGDEIAHLRELAEEAPVIELVNNIWGQAIDAGASDIHIEPDELEFNVRFRLDGILHTKMTLARNRFDAVASRIKLIGGLDIAERRLPQDGRISIRASGVEMDVRVSVIPGVHGESIVLRLLPKAHKDFSLARLGMEQDHQDQFRKLIKEPHGIVLVTGPTGSGKSTTLYTALAEANDRQRKIITVEDPVEYQMTGITQIQTHSEIGYSFARALRAILRHDPDVIMIGEIRDLETAEIAVQSALTGHMVFSTLHTNDAISAFNRLIDMGVEPFLVASSVRAVEAQRLVRCLCERCATEISEEDILQQVAEFYGEQIHEFRLRFPQIFSERPRWRIARGCSHCQNTGYKGRVGIYEFVEVTSELQRAIMQRLSVHEIINIAREKGYRNLREDGLIKAWRGETTLDEVIRVTGLNEEA